MIATCRDELVSCRTSRYLVHSRHSIGVVFVNNGFRFLWIMTVENIWIRRFPSFHGCRRGHWREETHCRQFSPTPSCQNQFDLLEGLKSVWGRILIWDTCKLSTSIEKGLLRTTETLGSRDSHFILLASSSLVVQLPTVLYDTLVL